MVLREGQGVKDGDAEADRFKEGFEALRAPALGEGLLPGKDQTLDARYLEMLELNCCL